MGIAVIREKFIDTGSLILSVANTMIANGFKPIYPVDEAGAFIPPSDVNLQKWKITLEATGAVDPLNKTEIAEAERQPWRVHFEVRDNATVTMVVGSNVALPATGTIPYTLALFNYGQSITTTRPKITGCAGIIGPQYTPYKYDQYARADFYDTAESYQPHWLHPEEGFINRRSKVWENVILSPSQTGVETPPVYPGLTMDRSTTYPLSYYLVISDRGFYLNVWQGAKTNMSGTDYSWVLVQRPVERDTGVTIVGGKAPVFCVNSVGGKIQRFVVRESDTEDASVGVSATEDTKDTTAIINDKRQVGVSENNQYIVNYPSRLNTARYAYTYELDMIGYASATVVSSTTEIPQTLYGETEPRKYIGMHSNIDASNGMRIVALKSGGRV